jgi:hypothetical protein
MKKILLAITFLLIPASVLAQPVINPTTAAFTASVDHNVVENGVSLVSNYELRIFTTGGTVPVRVQNLNKPTPDATNTITASITSVVTALPLGEYYATVAAKGPGGESVSAPSNPFSVAARVPAAPTNLRITK